MERIRSFMTGANLKRIALISMLIDHFAVAILFQGISLNSFHFSADINYLAQLLYSPLRMLGRLAFPLYIYLLIEGFHHTSSRVNYFKRMAVLCIVSEVPYDLALTNQMFDWNHQNIFFQLMLLMILFYFLEKFEIQPGKKLLALFPIMILAEYARIDYGMFGIIAGFIMYEAYGSKVREGLSVIPAFLFSYQSYFVYFSGILIYLYNGERGRVNKHFHYWAYPGHLFFYYLFRRLILL